MLKKAITYLAVLTATFALCAWLGAAYSYSDFKAYVDVLVNVSAMVFTIMGIWIAFLYPNALSRLADPAKIATADFSESLVETRRLEAIVASVLKSGLVLVLVLLVSLGKLFFYSSGFYSDNASAIKLLVLAIVTTLSYVQAEAVIAVLIANVLFLNDLHSRREERERDLDL